jgi:thioredoxin reductase (NADPH)
MAAGRDLGASMSQYLIDHLSALPNVEVRGRTQVAEVEADDRLRAVILRAGDAAEPVRLRADALFICIGGNPRTDGAAGIALATNTAGYLVTGSDAAGDPGRGWPLAREPLPLETNRPGVFAAGTCAAGPSNAAQQPSGRDRWRWRSSTGGLAEAGGG